MTPAFHCFWSLLDSTSLQFLYISAAIPHDIQPMLMSRSLLSLMHPDEAELARADLAKFIDSQAFGGSITRCRLRNVLIPDTASFEAADQWSVADVVMYVIDHQTVLALFHQVHADAALQSPATPRACGETLFDQANDAETLRAILGRGCYPPACPRRRGLHVFNSCTKSVLLSFPQAYHDDETDLPALARLIGKGSDASCVQCSRHKTCAMTTAGTMQVTDHILIPYGDITFAISDSQQHAAQDSLVYPPKEMTVQQRPPLVHTSSDPSSNRLPRLQDIPALAETCFIGRGGSPPPLPPRGDRSVAMMLTDDDDNIRGYEHAEQERRSGVEYDKGSGRCRPAISINADENDRESSWSHKDASDPLSKRPFVPYARRNTANISTTTRSSIPATSMRAYSPFTLQPSSMARHGSSRRCISSPNIAPPSTPMAAGAPMMRRRHSSSAKTNFCTSSRSQRYAASSSSTTTTTTTSSSCAAPVAPHHANHCESCGTTSSPEWRKGPSGHKTLCNACGLRYWRSVARKEKMAQQQKARSNEAYRHHHQHLPVNAPPPVHSGPPSPSSSCSSSSPLSPASPAPTAAPVPYADRRYDPPPPAAATTNLQPVWSLHPKLSH